jgi:hypothetical protein
MLTLLKADAEQRKGLCQCSASFGNGNVTYPEKPSPVQSNGSALQLAPDLF